jgi:serine/threonine-protein kinase
VRRLSGTPAYLAPEQILRQPVDERADIFAFGLTAYEMLTGKKPVTGNTFHEVIRKYASFEHHLKPLRAHVEDIPHAIERVVLKCLERDVSRRYPSMSLVVRDLQS